MPDETRTDRYEAMDQAKANAECNRRDARLLADCPRCKGRIVLHCDTCKIQITGCLCTEVDRFGAEAEGITKIYERMVERVGEEEARKQMRTAGLWIPPMKED